MQISQKLPAKIISGKKVFHLMVWENVYRSIYKTKFFLFEKANVGINWSFKI